MNDPLPVKPGSAAVRVALAGNPNAGKTSLFNALTGANQRVGNYPGITVERRVGHCTVGDRRLEIVDLPGTYSLAAYSPEERVAETELLSGALDVVVVVADATSLQRSLVLLAQVLLTGARVVLVLNFSDEAREAGQSLDLERMRALLDLPVLETVGNRGQGIEALRSAIRAAAEEPLRPPRLVLGRQLDLALAAIRATFAPQAAPASREGWLALRLLMGERPGDALAGAPSLPAEARAEAARQRALLEEETGQDVALFATHRFFGFVDGLLREVLRQRPRADARALSDSVDRVLVHRVWGLPIFAAVLYGIFWLTFSLGEAPMGWIEAGFAWLGETVTSLWPATSLPWLRSLLVDGVLAGVGGVLVFLPNIVLLFLGLAFLEDTGYMARSAFLMDRVLSRFGLHGKSFVPLVTGFGCTIPAIMATRTLENERDRLTTMLVLPLMSCGARLPIWLLLIPAFFAPKWQATALAGIYGVGVLLALLVAFALRKTLLKGDDAPFVLELPPYRLPTLRSAWLATSRRAWLYVRKAGTVILAISVALWALAAWPRPDAYQVDADVAAGRLTGLAPEQVEAARAAEDLRHSLAGRLGLALEPVLAPLGFDWKIATALVGAFAAKEVFVAQMGIVTSLGEVDETSEGLRDALRRDYSPLVGVSLMLFLLIATPCMATLAVTRRESGSWKWAFLQLGGLTGLAYVVSLIVYQAGRLFGAGS